MSKTILIIVGIICVIILAILLYAITKKLIENMTWKKALIILAILLVLLGVIAYLLFGSKGSDSIFSENVEGASSGNAEADTGVDENSRDSEMGFDIDDALEGNTQGDSTVYVTVSEDRICIGTREFEDTTAFAEAMESLKEDAVKISLVDDYALARIYRDVKSILEEKGLSFTEKSE